MGSVGGNLKSGASPKTRMEFRYYTSSEYNNLTKDQNNELCELRPPDEKGKSKGKRNSHGGKYGPLHTTNNTPNKSKGG